MLQSKRLRIDLRWLTSAALVLAALLLFAPRSTAGVYHVFSCRIPYGAQEGEAAPVQTAAGAGEEAGKWSKIASGVGADATDSCGSPEGTLAGYLTAGREHSKVDDAEWTFTAPTNEMVVAGTRLWRAGNANGGAGYGFWFSAPNDVFGAPDIFGPSCVYNAGCHTGIGSTTTFLSPNNLVEVSSENVPSSHLYINASCSSASCPSDAGDEQGHAVVVYIYAADIALEEQAAPSVSGLSGELASAEEVSGTASLFFNASDAGSGVYKEIASVDGRVVDSRIVDETGLCKEVAVPAEDGPAFLSAQPCPSSANGHVTLETTGLANGAHHLTVEVTDAAGNATTVLSKTIQVANTTPSSPGSAEQQQPTGPQAAAQLTTAGSPPLAAPTASAPNNGTPASQSPTLTATWARAAGARVGGKDGSRLDGAYGRAETITGRLTGPGGGPIADARIAVSARKSYGGAQPVALVPVLTGAAGRFTLHLAGRSPSEQIQIAYSPTLGGHPVVTRTLALSVRAGVRLHVTPTAASTGATIHLQGRILGGPIPSGGKEVVLEARSKGSRWLQFLVLRTGRGGRFRGAHRFRLPGPVRYWFRAVCPQEADFPFATGSSAQATVWER